LTQDQYCWPFFFASDRENSTNVETQHEVLIDETLWNIRDAHVYRDVYRDSYPLQADRPLDERRARVSHTLDPHTFPKSTWTRKIITWTMTYPVPRASPAVDSPCLQTQTSSSRQPLREQTRVLPRLRRQQHRRPSRGGRHVRRLRRTGAHRGGVRDAGAKHEPHEHVAVRLLRRRSRPRHRVRPSQEEQVHQDVRIGRRRVARASEDVLEAVRSAGNSFYSIRV